MKSAATKLREHKERFPHLCLSSMTIGVREMIHVLESEITPYQRSITTSRLLKFLQQQNDALNALEPTKVSND